MRNRTGQWLTRRGLTFILRFSALPLLVLLCLWGFDQLSICFGLDHRQGEWGHQHRRRSIRYDPRYLGFHFEHEPESVVAVNEEALLHCAYRLNADRSSTEELLEAGTRVEWRKDGVPLNHLRSIGRISVLSNGSLHIVDVNNLDEGAYQCAVHVSPTYALRQTSQDTRWTFLSRRAFVSLPALQRFEYQPVTQKVFVGQSAAFRCMLDSKPPAMVEWYRNNARLNEMDGHGISFLPLSSTLVIHNATERHSGSYKCIARNGRRSRTSQAAHLDVTAASPNIVNTAISLVLEPRSQLANTGGSFLLECLANANPHPRVRWLHGSTLLQNPEEGSHQAAWNRIKWVGVGRRSSLLVTNAQLNDSGVYTCRVENGDDSVDSPATITIRAPPKIMVAPMHQTTTETTDTEFECAAEGNPPPRITWFKNGELIVPSEYFVIASNRLKIFGLVRQDQGIYQCFADNEVGSTQASAQLLVDNAVGAPTLVCKCLFSPYVNGGCMQIATLSLSLVAVQLQNRSLICVLDAVHMALSASGVDSGVPSQPTGLEATEVSARSMTLKWIAPPNQHSLGSLLYHVFYREEESTRERVANTTSTTVLLEGLHPRASYVIRVAAESEGGLGKSSDAVVIATISDELLPGKVRNLLAHILTADSMRVDWDAPEQAGIAPTHYKLYYAKTNTTAPPTSTGTTAKEEETKVRLSAAKTSYTLHSMDRDTWYSIRVEAESQNGTGPSSDTIQLKTPSDVPSAPPQQVRVDVTGPSSVQIRWLPPPSKQQNGLITGYKIRYKTKRKGARGGVAVVNANAGSHTIEDLAAGSHYAVRIAAMNQNGTGPFSDWFGVNIPEEEREEEEVQVAGAPSELRVHAAHDLVQVAWLPPVDENVVVRGYVLGWGINVPDVEKTSVGADARHYEIRGLKPNREYVISLRAFNKVGNGFPIYETVRTSSRSETSQTANSAPTLGQPMNAPVGVYTETLSATSIRVGWTDPNEHSAFNQYYTIRYASSGGSGESDPNAMRQVNTSETEHIIDGLAPNTAYEFAVKLVGFEQWSMSVINRTLPAPPSSAPRELSVNQHHPSGGGGGEQEINSVILNWQPPKYANGDIEEYIVLYSERLELPDREWIIDSVKGERLSMVIENLLPGSSYYFKMQARNVKGYGPLSPVVTYIPSSTNMQDISAGGDKSSKGRKPHGRRDDDFEMGRLLRSNLVYLIVGVIGTILLLLCAVLVAACLRKKSGGSAEKQRRRRQRQQKDVSQMASDCRGGYLQQNSLLMPHRQHHHQNMWMHEEGDTVAAGFAALNADYISDPPMTAIEVTRYAGASYQMAEHPVSSSPPVHHVPTHRYQMLEDGGMSQSQTSYLSNIVCSCSPRDPPLSSSSRHQRKSLPPRIASSCASSTSPPPRPVRTAANPRTAPPPRPPTRTIGGAQQLPTAVQHARRIPTSSVSRPLPIVHRENPYVNRAEAVGRKESPIKSVYFASDVDVCIGRLVAPSSSQESPAAVSQSFHSVDRKTTTFGLDADEGVKCETSPHQSSKRDCHSDLEESGGTLSRSYHQSSSSLKAARQWTPQMHYAGISRPPMSQACASSGNYDTGRGGSTTGLQLISNYTPPPPPPFQPHPMDDGMDANVEPHGYISARELNPLQSFTAQLGANAPPPPPEMTILPSASGAGDMEMRRAHIVRPVVFGSASNGVCKPAGIVIGQKSSGTNVPIGRAQPRVNVANIICSPYSTVKGPSAGTSSGADNTEIDEGQGGPNSSSAGSVDDKGSEDFKPQMRGTNSIEDINDINVHEIDNMIDTLQQLQQEFTER